MTDIYVALMLVLAVSMGAFHLVRLLVKRLSPRQSDLAAVAVVGLTLVYCGTLWYSVRLAEFLPFSNLIVLGNWFLPFSAALAGSVWHRIPGGLTRRGTSLGVLMGTAGFAVISPFTGPALECRDSWSPDGFCWQTTDQTCSAACAASLLAQAGISATEQELADLCFSAGGTTWQGLYRGLKLKTQGTGWKVQVLDAPPAKLSGAVGPMILSVGMPWDAERDTPWELESGWIPGTRHSVLLLGPGGGETIKIFDPNPAIGHERWTRQDLEVLYRGPTLQLVPRTPSALASL